MINLAVISLREIIKFIKNVIITIIIVIIILCFLGKIKKGNYIKIEELKENSFLKCSKIIDKNILISNYYNNENISRKSGIKKILASELAILGTEEELMEKENQEEIVEFENINKDKLEKNISNKESEKTNVILENDNNEMSKDTSIVMINQVNEVLTDLPTQIINENNKIDKFTDTYKTVKIKNESKYELTEEILTPNIDFLNKKDIIIYHTHTCESYTPTEINNYVSSGNFRTTDLNYSVARVGNELANYLTEFGFNVNHNKNYHDYPAYTGSYTRALSTIKKVLENNNSELVIDLHRDALGSNSEYGPSVKIGEETAAQLMFVMGTDGGGLEHSNWQTNLKFAIKIQEKANEMYPGLFKPIILRDSRYNQHVAKGACIIEVGATGNTLEECNISMKYLAKVIEEVMK